MKIVAIVQARMGSTRLPGKVLKEINKKSLLNYQIERMNQIKLINQIVVATTPNGNEEIINLCKFNNLDYFIGSENNVLERYYQAAKKFDADIIVRMTADCPLIDPDVVNQIISYYLENNFDYVSNTQKRTFPRGLDAEVFSFKALEKAYNEANKDYELEHVTPYIYLNKNLFTIGQYTQEIDLSGIRLTVDTREDFQLVQSIISELYAYNNNFRLQDIINLLNQKPQLLEINKNIQQKKLGE